MTGASSSGAGGVGERRLRSDQHGDLQLHVRRGRGGAIEASDRFLDRGDVLREVAHGDGAQLVVHAEVRAFEAAAEELHGGDDDRADRGAGW